MKIEFLMKTPDALDDCTSHLSEEEREEANRVAKLFMKFGEIVKLELDTEEESCRVLPA